MTSSPTPIDREELTKQLKKHFLAAAGSLALLAALAAILMIRFRPELDAFTEMIFAAVGIYGLIAIIFVTDTFVSPFPPDSVLILIAASSYHEHWLWLLPLIGLFSSIAGCIGYALGRILSTRAWAQRWFGTFHGKSEDRVRQYGPWAVALGALTPVPFSVTCWTAGLLRLDFRSFLPPALLRIPRYFVYYAAIAYLPRLVS